MTRHRKAIALTRGVDGNPPVSLSQAGPELLAYCVSPYAAAHAPEAVLHAANMLIPSWSWSRCSP
jgi:hypothetical protein